MFLYIPQHCLFISEGNKFVYGEGAVSLFIHIVQNRWILSTALNVSVVALIKAANYNI